MSLNRTSKWKVMTIGISRELLLFNFERLDELCPWIGHPSKKSWPFVFLERFRCSFERLDILCPIILYSCEKLWPFKFLESFCYLISSFSIYYVLELYIRVKSYDHLNFSRGFVVQFRASRYIMRLNRTTVWKVMTIWISRQVSLFNLERLDILCAWIGHPCEKLWP